MLICSLFLVTVRRSRSSAISKDCHSRAGILAVFVPAIHSMHIGFETWSRTSSSLACNYGLNALELFLLDSQAK
jgi:hypothetical protein